MDKDHAVTDAASSVSEVTIGISPVSSEDLQVKPDDAVPELGSAAPPLVSTGNQFMRAIGFDGRVHIEDERFSRSFFGTFADLSIEADYERERPGINVVNGHRQVLLLHTCLGILRPIFFGGTFFNELDGRYEEEFLLSMLLVTLLFLFLIIVNAMLNCSSFWNGSHRCVEPVTTL